MINRIRVSLIFIFFACIFTGCEERAEHQSDPLMKGDFWKDQAINDIIIPWTTNGLDVQKGTFPAYMDRQWQPFNSDHTYPGMVARHVFSYSTAYMLTGNEEYLDIATRIVEYLIQHGWDRENRLWYNALDNEGNPVDADKDMFMQLYAVTGLSMYYVVTREQRILDYIQNSIDLLNSHALDHQNGGYINALNSDLTIKDSSKRATPQLAPLSGYLAYLYPVTKDEQYLAGMKTGVELILDKMMNPEGSWLLESFDQQWKVNSEQSSRINVGHNLEVVWMLLRLHLLTGDETFKERALALYPRMYEVTFNEGTGAWYHHFMIENTDEKPDTTPWWIQAYGNMLELYLYRITGEQKHLIRFQKGAEFWNNSFIDKEFGGAYLKAGIDGTFSDGNKAVRSKTSYHSMEHGLLNYLYLNLWVQKEPVTLYFKIHASQEGERFLPSIIEDPETEIRSVLVNGKKWDDFSVEEGFITLPALDNGEVQVKLVNSDK